MLCSDIRSWHAWSWEWRDDWCWVSLSLQHLGTCQGTHVFPYVLNNAVSIIKLSACPHCNPGSNGVGSSSDRVWCALDEPADKGHTQQRRGHRSQPRQALTCPWYLLHMDFQCTQTTVVITDSLGVQGKKVQSDNGLEVLLDSELLVVATMTKLYPQHSKANI